MICRRFLLLQCCSGIAAWGYMSEIDMTEFVEYQIDNFQKRKTASVCNHIRRQPLAVEGKCPLAEILRYLCQ